MTVEGGPPPPAIDGTRSSGNRGATKTLLIVGAVACVGILAVLGLVLIGQGEYQTSNDTVTLDRHGNPEIVTMSCRTRGIGHLVVVRDSDGATVFTATLRAGRAPQPGVSIDTAADGDYDKALPLGPLDPNTIYKPARLDDEKGIGIGATEQAFRPTDLRVGQANGGFTHDGSKIDPTPLEQWRADTQAHFRGC